MPQPTASTADLDRLQRKIGYRFEQLALLKQALTHKSYSKTNNERLEFMGDAVLGYLVGNMLYQHYPDVQEDALSLMRANSCEVKHWLRWRLVSICQSTCC